MYTNEELKNIKSATENIPWQARKYGRREYTKCLPIFINDKDYLGHDENLRLNSETKEYDSKYTIYYSSEAYKDAMSKSKDHEFNDRQTEALEHLKLSLYRLNHFIFNPGELQYESLRDFLLNGIDEIKKIGSVIGESTASSYLTTFNIGDKVSTPKGETGTVVGYGSGNTVLHVEIDQNLYGRIIEHISSNFLVKL